MLSWSFELIKIGYGGMARYAYRIRRFIFCLHGIFYVNYSLINSLWEVRALVNAQRSYVKKRGRAFREIVVFFPPSSSLGFGTRGGIFEFTASIRAALNGRSFVNSRRSAGRHGQSFIILQDSKDLNRFGFEPGGGRLCYRYSVIICRLVRLLVGDSAGGRARFWDFSRTVVLHPSVFSILVLQSYGAVHTIRRRPYMESKRP